MRILRPRNLFILGGALLGLWAIWLLGSYIYRQNAPVTFINGQAEKDYYSDQLWEKGLRFEDGAINPLWFWAPRGSTKYELTARATGVISIEGDLVVTAYIPSEQLESPSGLGTAKDDAKIAALMDVDYCTVPSSTTKVGDTIKIQAYAVTCKGGHIRLTQPLRIVVIYQGVNPYLNRVPTTIPLGVPHREILPELLTPVPGEEHP